jgi:hypothetical protein
MARRKSGGKRMFQAGRATGQVPTAAHNFYVEANRGGGRKRGGRKKR